MTTRHLATALFTLLLATGAASAQTARELLERAIYTQDTLGDRDTAIQLYYQLLKSVPSNRSYAAQAQYRLTLCLAQKGDRAAANAEFQVLARNFQDQPDLVSRARAQVYGLTLLEEPWGVDETSQFAISDRNSSGYSYSENFWEYSARVSSGNSHSVVFDLRQSRGITMDRDARVEADRDSMRPLSSSKHEGVQEFRVDYGSDQAKLQRGGVVYRKVALSGPVFDHEELPFLLRRLPLTVGYTALLPLVSDKGVSSAELSVSGMEEVRAPAGTYRCYTVELPALHMTYWIAADGSRPLVKLHHAYETGLHDFVAELVSTGPPGSVSRYVNPALGVSFDLPPGWVATGCCSYGQVVYVSNPETNAYFMFQMYRRTGAPAEREVSAAQIEKKMSDFPLEWSHWYGHGNSDVARPESVRRWTIGGRPAVSAIFDIDGTVPGDSRKHAYFVLWMGTETMTLSAVAFAADPDLAALQRQMEPIIQSLKIEPPQ